jgi:hypothetical protein
MTDVFDPNPENTDAQPSGDQAQAGDPLAELVGEGKKFASASDLAKGKLEADAFIEQLKQEQKELRSDLERANAKAMVTDTVKDLMSNQEGKDTANQPDPFTPDQLNKLVDERLKLDRAEQNSKANRETANAAVLKHFSNDAAKAKAFIAEEAQRLSMSPSQLADISADSPAAFLRLVGINQPSANPGTSFDTVVNPDAGAGDSTVRDNSYYQQKRKELGHRFYEADIQQQRMRDRAALGDRFYK